MHSEAVRVNVAACVGIIHTGCKAGSDLDVFLLLLLDKANVSQDSHHPSALLIPSWERSVPFLLLGSFALSQLLVFKPFSRQTFICQGSQDFWWSWCYQKCALFHVALCAYQCPGACQATMVHWPQGDLLRPPRARGSCLFGGFGSVPGATWPRASAVTAPVLWSISGSAFSFTSSVTAGCRSGRWWAWRF